VFPFFIFILFFPVISSLLNLQTVSTHRSTSPTQ
jgi:hypothetical protein